MIGWIVFSIVTFVAVWLAYRRGYRDGCRNAPDGLTRLQERDYKRIAEEGQRLGRPLTLEEIINIFIGALDRNRGPNTQKCV
jgi:hypothetical protein